MVELVRIVATNQFTQVFSSFLKLARLWRCVCVCVYVCMWVCVGGRGEGETGVVRVWYMRVVYVCLSACLVHGEMSQ